MKLEDFKMNTIMDELSKAQRKVQIIGTIPLTDSEHWSNFIKILADKIDNNDMRCEIIAESDNQLFQLSLRTDTSYARERIAFQQYKFRRDLLKKEADKRKEKALFHISTIDLPFNIIKIDDQLFYLPITGYFDKLGRFKRITSDDSWFEILDTYVSCILDKTKEGRYLAKPGAELLELFDQDHIPRGIYPRDCFYDTDHYQFVVWGFVFSRDGHLLIHKRKENAKDNQGMWDKSIGGHIDFTLERSSADAAVRELIEELYTKEKNYQTGHEFTLLSEDTTKLKYLGDWRPEDIGPEYIDHIGLLEKDDKPGEEPWVFYKLPGTIERNTPRIIPEALGGGERKLRVLADVFIFIANTQLTPEYAKKTFKNSKYLMVSPSLLKTWVDQKKDDNGDVFIPTPDLEFVMTGKLRNTIDEVCQLISYSSIRKK